jgi:hypothetical protein
MNIPIGNVVGFSFVCGYLLCFLVVSVMSLLEKHLEQRKEHEVLMNFDDKFKADYLKFGYCMTNYNKWRQRK